MAIMIEVINPFDTSVNLPNSICFVSRRDISQKTLLSMRIISLVTFHPFTKGIFTNYVCT